MVVKSGVGVSVGTIWMAPTQEERNNTVLIMIERATLNLLMIYPFNDTLWASLEDLLSIPENVVIGKFFTAGSKGSYCRF
ncbi:MAG: hypothetical protein ACWGOY_01740 [Anaerolineales bacterium]